jgi:transposase
LIAVPMGVRIYLALGATDMRKSFDGLALLVQETLKHNPFICVGRHYVAASRRSG